MSFAQFMVSTVVVEHIISTRDAWGSPFVQTLYTKGRLVDSRVLFYTATEGARTSSAQLFLPASAVIAPEDAVHVGGVRYRVKTVRPVRSKSATLHHLECDLEAGR